jgi:hypothetical protein
MVVNEFDIFSCSINPAEANPPLIIDSNGPLTGPTTRQFLQSVSWWYQKHVNRARRINLKELAPRHTRHMLGNRPDAVSLEKGVSSFVMK